MGGGGALRHATCTQREGICLYRDSYSWFTRNRFLDSHLEYVIGRKQ